jgi:hypothetical protein
VLLAASAPVIAACDGKNDDAQRAVEISTAETQLSSCASGWRRAAVSSCRIAPQPGRSDQLLTIITTTGRWLQATINPDVTLPAEDVTVGGEFAPKAEAEYRKRGEACKVSAADGSVSLE